MTAMAAFRETAISFPCEGQTLQGVLSVPPDGQALAAVGLVIIVGGPQYRVGSHRQFVLLARHLAAAGHAVLRFDVRGMGDSTGEQRKFHDLRDDIAAGLDALIHTTGVRNVALWGLCDGASASLLYMHATSDRRVVGVAMANPWVRSEQSLARTHVKKYYLQRLLESSFWEKLLRGGVGLLVIRDLWRNVALASGLSRARETETFQHNMAEAWQSFGGHILVFLSSKDWTANEFEECVRHAPRWRGARDKPRLHWQVIEGADHTFSSALARHVVEQATLSWLEHLTSTRC